MLKQIFQIVAVLVLGTSALALKSKYIIGEWVPAHPDEISRQLQPIFETYLNEAVGTRHNPPLTFEFLPIDYSSESDPEHLVPKGAIDFIYTLAGRVACIQVQNGWIPIATQKALIGNVETGAQGSLLYSLKANPKIRNITDFKDKKIGAGYLLSSNSYHLGYKLLKSHGVDLYSDVAQFILYGNDYAEQLDAVMKGRIDGGILPSTWLIHNHPEYLDKLIIHRPVEAEYEGEPFPFPTSTEVVPQPGLLASPEIPWRLKMEVSNALGELNRSNPITWPVGISTFTVPGSYAFPRSVMEDMGILITNPIGGDCVSPFERPLSTIACPDNFVRQNPLAASMQCHRNGLECPPGGYPCFCHPCIPDLQVMIFSGKIVLGLSCTLFVMGLTISVCWIIPVELSFVAVASTRAAGRIARRASDAYRRPRPLSLHKAGRSRGLPLLT